MTLNLSSIDIIIWKISLWSNSSIFQVKLVAGLLDLLHYSAHCGGLRGTARRRHGTGTNKVHRDVKLFR